jgi:hypothetical protein
VKGEAMSDTQMLLGLFVLLLQVASTLGLLLLLFVLGRGLLRLIVRLVHAEWSRCEDRGTGETRALTPEPQGGLTPTGALLLVLGIPWLLALLALLSWGSVL